MGGIKSLLDKVIDKAPHAKLLKLVFKGLKGELDTKPMKTSPASSGKKLVLKGWQGKDDAVSVKYVADWDNLDSGTITFKRAEDKGYKGTTDGKAVYSGGGGKLSLKLTFKDSSGKAHASKFWSELL